MRIKIIGDHAGARLVRKDRLAPLTPRGASADDCFLRLHRVDALWEGGVSAAGMRNLVFWHLYAVYRSTVRILCNMREPD